jgi:hypothetical protein
VLQSAFGGATGTVAQGNSDGWRTRVGGGNGTNGLYAPAAGTSTVR